MLETMLTTVNLGDNTFNNDTLIEDFSRHISCLGPQLSLVLTSSEAFLFFKILFLVYLC